MAKDYVIFTSNRHLTVSRLLKVEHLKNTLDYYYPKLSPVAQELIDSQPMLVLYDLMGAYPSIEDVEKCASYIILGVE